MYEQRRRCLKVERELWDKDILILIALVDVVLVGAVSEGISGIYGDTPLHIAWQAVGVVDGEIRLVA